MTAISSSKRPRTYAISYGFVGGPLHARKFKRLMSEAGFINSIDGQKADIIVAHSAGCWLIDKDSRPQLVLYVGTPLTMSRPQSAWLQANVTGLRHDLWRGLKVKIINGYYAVRQPRRNLDILRHPKIGQPVVLPNSQAIFVANRYDPWPKTTTIAGFVRDHDWIFLSLPGVHDDIWERPELYVSIIKCYARLLAPAKAG